MIDKLFKITENTDFPVKENGQDFVISANTLLRNIQLLLGQATTRQTEQTQQDILTRLGEVEKLLKYCLSRSNESHTLAQTSYNFNTRVWDKTLENSSEVAKLKIENKRILQRLNNIDKQFERLGL